MVEHTASNMFDRVLVANRGEISTRVARAIHELGAEAVTIYSKEDEYAKHRRAGDKAVLLNPAGSDLSPIGAYLAIDRIIQAAKETGAQAIHPGYGFLSENADFAQACEDNGIVFVGPTPETLAKFGAKTTARSVAVDAGLPVIPGSDSIPDVDAAVAFAESAGFPLMVKAAMGGGGKVRGGTRRGALSPLLLAAPPPPCERARLTCLRLGWQGMRVCHDMDELKEGFVAAKSEAEASFGSGDIFIERYLVKPRHVEVQIIADGVDVVHLHERDCSVQRRNQKVIEIAPSINLDEKIRDKLLADAVKIAKAVGYRGAGTVEFLVSGDEHFFIEVNPRVQVEHTISEQVTGVDIVQTQLQIAAGATLKDLGLTQDAIQCRGYAMQCRITTEVRLRNPVGRLAKRASSHPHPIPPPPAPAAAASVGSAGRLPPGRGCDLHVPVARGPWHSPRRHRLHGPGDRAALRLSAHQGDCQREHLPDGLCTHAPRSPRVCHRRRRHEHPVFARRHGRRGVPVRHL